VRSEARAGADAHRPRQGRLHADRALGVGEARGGVGDHGPVADRGAVADVDAGQRDHDRALPEARPGADPHLAAGRVDAVCSLKAARSVDIAAAQLLVRERGLAIDLFEDPPFEAAPLDVEGRSRVVAAGTPELCRQLATALSA
jgi:hypothetical protein